MIKEKQGNINQNHLLTPTYPRMESPARVFVVWDISYRCNYNCSYCTTHKSLAIKDSRCISIEEMRKISQDMYRDYSSCHIRFSGGEPFIYPDFIEFLRILSEYHTLEVSTNLPVDVEELKDKLNPEGLLLSTSFHAEFVNAHEFLKKALFLKDHGFNVSVTFVAYPPFIGQTGYFKELFEKSGLQFIIQPFKGVFCEKKYPDEYTDKEKALLRDCIGTSLHKDANQKILEHRISAEDNRIKLCRMGQMYARIDPSGNAFRCCASDSPKLGNILESGLKLLNEPSVCGIESCPCWKAMVVGCEEKWLSQWEYPRHPKQYIPEKKQENNKVIPAVNISANFLKSDIAPYRAFFTWDVHYRCNYKCSYCNAQKPGQEDFIEARYLEVDRWMAVWGDIYKKYGSCEIQLTGGEPLIYPGVMDLIIRLSKIHTLEFSTNLSWDVWPFVKNITPERARIGVSFHPEFADFRIFFEKVLTLKKNGFEVWVNYVAYPPLLKDLAKYKFEVEKEKIHFSVLPFSGKFEGKSYPDSYSDLEKKIMNGENNDIVNKKTIDWKVEKQNVTTKGKLCRMGQMYAKIHPDGEASRCCNFSSSKLGNITDGTFELLREPMPCECDQCPCWRCMLVGNESEWSSHWTIPKKREVSIYGESK